LVSIGFAQPMESDYSLLREQLEAIVGEIPDTRSSPIVREATQEYIIGRHLAAQDKHGEALLHFRLAAKLDDNSPAPWVGMAVSQAALGRGNASIARWKEVIKRDPSQGDALLVLGLDAARYAYNEQARDYLSQRWLQQDDESVEALLRDAALISVLHKLENDDVVSSLQVTFQPVLNEAVAALVDGAHSGTWRNVLQQLIDVDATSIAIDLIVESAQHVGKQEQSAILKILPVLEAATGRDGSTTRDVFEQVLDSNGLFFVRQDDEPTSLGGWLSLAAQSMSLLGADDGSITLYEASIVIEPDNKMVANNLAWLRLLRDGPTEIVVALCEKAIAMDPEEPNFLDTHGWMYVLQGKPEKGIPLFIQAVRNARLPNPITYVHLGDAYWVLGQEDKATRAWQTAATILYAPETRRSMIEQYSSWIHSVLGISVATPEAMYDLELGEVTRQLMKKLTAVEEGNIPPVDAAAIANGAD
jgi:tetratricopeptide (TPR) repeat protein